MRCTLYDEVKRKFSYSFVYSAFEKKKRLEIQKNSTGFLLYRNMPVPRWGRKSKEIREEMETEGS